MNFLFCSVNSDYQVYYFFPGVKLNIYFYNPGTNCSIIHLPARCRVWRNTSTSPIFLTNGRQDCICLHWSLEQRTITKFVLGFRYWTEIKNKYYQSWVTHMVSFHLSVFDYSMLIICPNSNYTEISSTVAIVWTCFWKTKTIHWFCYPSQLAKVKSNWNVM